MLRVDEAPAAKTAAAPAALTALTAPAAPMRALLHRRHGDPSEPGVLVMGQAPRPLARADEVVVAVYAANASIGDHHIVSGKPYLVRLSPWGGLPGPRGVPARLSPLRP